MALKALSLLLAAGPLLAGPLLASDGGTQPQQPPAEKPKPKEASLSVSLASEADPVERNQTPGRVKIYGADEIASSGARSLGEFLGYVLPGQAQGSGQPGLASSPYVGGSRPQDTQVLLDGVRLSDPSASGLDLSKIPLVGIDRIEVLEGTASARFGTHAMGGVIALYSAGTTGAGAHGDIATGGGSGGAKRGGVLPSFGWNGGWIRLGSLYYEDKPTTETSTVYRQGSVYGAIGQKLGERTTLTLSYRNFYQVVPDPYLKATPLERLYDPDRRSELRGNQGTASLRWSLGSSASLDLGLGLVNLRRVEPRDGTLLQDRFDSHRTQFFTAFNWKPRPRWGFSFMLDAQEERATLPGLLGGEDRGRGRSVAGSFEARYDLTSSLRLLANLRHERIRQRFMGQDGKEVDFGTRGQATYRLGANQALPYGLHIYAALGTGYNSPLLLHAMENARLGLGNPQNERSQFMQVGLGWELGRFSTRVEMARTRYDDLIYAVSTDVPEGGAAAKGDRICGYCPPGAAAVAPGYLNGRSYRVQGVEATAGYRTGWKLPLGLDAFIRNQEARDLQAPAGQEFSTPTVQNRPFTTHGIRLYLGGTKMRVETRWNRVGRRYESVKTFACSDLQPLVVPTFVSYDDLSVTTIYTFGRAMSLIVRGEHLAQKNISITDWQGRKTDLENNAALVYGIPAPKPTVTVEARFRY